MMGRGIPQVVPMTREIIGLLSLNAMKDLARALSVTAEKHSAMGKDRQVAILGSGLITTNEPVLQAYAKSSTTFTAAALTVAAATFTSYDCTAGHN
jgi:hypothetical protein